MHIPVTLLSVTFPQRGFSPGWNFIVKNQMNHWLIASTSKKNLLKHSWSHCCAHSFLSEMSARHVMLVDPLLWVVRLLLLTKSTIICFACPLISALTTGSHSYSLNITTYSRLPSTTFSHLQMVLLAWCDKLSIRSLRSPTHYAN